MTCSNCDHDGWVSDQQRICGVEVEAPPEGGVPVAYCACVCPKHRDVRKDPED